MKQIVFTGTFDSGIKAMKSVAEAAGFKVVGSVTNNVNLLVVGNAAGSKLVKAGELGVQCLTAADFLNMYGEKPSVVDWSTAPVDATHCDIGGNHLVWLKEVENNRYHYLNSANEWELLYAALAEQSVARPVKQLNRDDAIKLLAALEHNPFVSAELNELKAYGWCKDSTPSGVYFWHTHEKGIESHNVTIEYPEGYHIRKQNKYHRELKGATVDVYDVLKAFNVTCPATQHALKKMLCAGLRGHKDIQTDLDEAIASLQRAKELV